MVKDFFVNNIIYIIFSVILQHIMENSNYDLLIGGTSILESKQCESVVIIARKSPKK